METWKIKISTILKSLWQKDWSKLFKSLVIRTKQTIGNWYREPSNSMLKVLVNYMYTLSVGATIVLFFEHNGDKAVKIFSAVVAVASLAIACKMANWIEKNGG